MSPANTRYVCVHGHFYQPPRENPWLEAIEVQDSAYPYHDWNERITAECYGPNAASRMLDGDDFILSIVNNYSRISFNFGPTLLSWMEEKAPEVYKRVLEADRESRARFSGHGSALAQVYNHMILPLANRRDRTTQIRWGIRDFERRFERKPEGMWLPETAVDLETLDLLAEHGIEFTVLAPRQAARVRSRSGGDWEDVRGGRVDPSRAYLQELPSGRSIALFFYDGPVSRAVAFENLLVRGEDLANRIVGLFRDDREGPQLAHIATDGETYGHHHRHGEMALTYALHTLEERQGISLTNYGEFLERHPPQDLVEIVENSSWSCVHGIERWKSNCGCNTGRAGWSQAWRAPLREALDWLRDSVAPLYEKQGAELFRDPWAARDAYVDVVLDRSPENVSAVLRAQAARDLDPAARTRALQLLELQRHALLMYTSCGWFFDEISGIESVQVIAYAARAIQLAGLLFETDFESGFLERLERAPSNLPEYGNGRAVYEKLVKPAAIDLPKVGAHYALSCPFEIYGERTEIYAFLVEREDYRMQEMGRSHLVLGRARVTSRITGESELLSFGVLHFGDHNLSGGVRSYQDEARYEEMIAPAVEAFERAEIAKVLRLLDGYFQTLTYSVRSLFRDEQRKVVELILDSTLESAEAVYRHLYESHASLISFLADLAVPQPRAFRAAAELVLYSDLRRELQVEGDPDARRVEAILEMARRQRVSLNSLTLGYAFQRSLESLARRFRQQPQELHTLEVLTDLLQLVGELPFEIDWKKVQDLYYDMLHEELPRFRERAQGGEEGARVWVGLFERAGALLKVRVS